MEPTIVDQEHHSDHQRDGFTYVMKKQAGNLWTTIVRNRNDQKKYISVKLYKASTGVKREVKHIRK